MSDTAQLVDDAPAEIQDRETHHVVLLVNYDMHSGDVVPDEREWKYRLRLAGLDVRAVLVQEPDRKVKREPRSEPRDT